MSKCTVTFPDKHGALKAVEDHLTTAEGQVQIDIESKIVVEMGRVAHIMTITTNQYIIPERVDDVCLECGGRRIVKSKQHTGTEPCPVCTRKGG